MKDERLCLIITFLFALLPALVVPAIAPHLKLAFFVPFLVLMLYHTLLRHALWTALACGIIMDLLSSHPRLGLHALTYCATLTILYKIKRQFFVDQWTTLPLMTYIFSAVATLMQIMILLFFSPSLSISWQWILVDVGLMPFLDAIYALIWFAYPAWLLKRCPRRSF